MGQYEYGSREIKVKPDISSANYQKVLNSALRILTGRDHSRHELLCKLKQRGFAPQDIAKAVSECERLDYINDERTARLYIRQMTSKGYGVKRIRHAMNQKGLRGKRIQHILDETISNSDEQKSAARIWQKNIKRFERENDLQKRKQKVYRFLYARGFPPDIIRKLANKF
jgi:regulatory protein